PPALSGGHASGGRRGPAGGHPASRRALSLPTGAREGLLAVPGDARRAGRPHSPDGRKAPVLVRSADCACSRGAAGPARPGGGGAGLTQRLDRPALALRRGFRERRVPALAPDDRGFGSTSRIISISTGMPMGNSAMPTAERA